MKKKIKLIILLLIPFILCGCSVKYELEVNSNSLSEKITFRGLDSKGYKMLESLKKSYGQDYDISFNSFTKTVVAERFSMSFDDFLNSSIGSQYFMVNINKGTNIDIRAHTDHDTLLNYYFEFDPNDESDLVISEGDTSKFNLDVKLMCNNKVTINNADKIFGKSYSWNFKDNNLDKTITFSYDPKVTLNDWTILYLAGIVLVVGGIVVFILNNKSKKVNKI